VRLIEETLRLSIRESSHAGRTRDYGGSFASLYRRYARDRIKRPINRQRLKLVYDAWWYYPILAVRELSLKQRLTLLWKFLRIDWFVLHGSKPAEVVPVMIDLMARRGAPREAFVEAGCWNGGSTAKFSLVCKLYGYELHVFDSFQGVEEWGFAYAAQEADVRANLATYGALDVCSLHPGWFRDTLWNRPVPFPVRMVYLDCDVPQGSIEVLSGILPSLVADGVVYTQDYRIKDVRRVIDDAETWSKLGVGLPRIEPLIRNLARITWSHDGGVDRAQ
jgi:O-methyltransferase